MMTLRIAGWFECRLATDPDPTDEPRGVSGWTYAVAGEPDLDRIIRPQPAAAVQRRLGPPVGVTVRSVEVDGQPSPQHWLGGAAFELLDNPVFEGRNGLASEDTEEPIYPFHCCVSKEDVVLRREFRDLQTGEWRFERSAGIAVDRSVLAEAGVGDPQAHLQARREALTQALQAATTLTERVAFEARLKHLEQRGFGVVPLFVGLRYHYVLEGPWVEVRDPGARLGHHVEFSPWLVDMWVGCWDADALCGYMKGTLTLPSRPESTGSAHSRPR